MIATAFTKKTITAEVAPETWTRPADWLPLPDVPAQGLVGLCAVPSEGAYVAILARTNLTAASGGRYVVDWGDGTPAQEIDENTTVTKELNYANYSEASLSSRGYRQAIITVTPKTGQNLTLLRLVSYTPRPYTTSPWLDIEINSTTALTSLLLVTSNLPFHRQLERVKIHSLGNVTSTAQLFLNCSALAEVILPSTSKITGMNSMFNGCTSLLSVPAMDTSKVTNMASMFLNCYKLKSVPAMNTSLVTNMSSMFSNCLQLKSVPAMDTSKVATMASMFNNCVSLESVQSSFSTGLCTAMNGMFNLCRSLKTPPAFTDTSKVTTISQIFYGCTELLTAPAMNCALVKGIYGAFALCHRLTALPDYVFPQDITDARLFIRESPNIKSLANLTFSGTIAKTQEFALNAFSLTAVPALNVSTDTGSASAFNRCYNLADVPDGFMLGCKTSTDFRYCSLSAAALNKIFTSLATIPSTQTTKPIIYIRGNPGTATCNTSLATVKNWTVDTTTV